MSVPAYPQLEPPAPLRHSALGTRVAWLVIAACVGLIVAAGLRPRSPEPLAAGVGEAAGGEVAPGR
jgi:hypothetical protein